MIQRILTKQATKHRHKHMICKSYLIKIDKSLLSEKLLDKFRRLFLEAKWFTNYAIASGVFNFDYKTKTVQVKTGDIFEEKQIQILTSQMRQAIVDKLKQDIKNLSVLKSNGTKVGKLKFKRFIRTIPLEQYNLIETNPESTSPSGDCDEWQI